MQNIAWRTEWVWSEDNMQNDSADWLAKETGIVSELVLEGFDADIVEKDPNTGEIVDNGHDPVQFIIMDVITKTLHRFAYNYDTVCGGSFKELEMIG